MHMPRKATTSVKGREPTLRSLTLAQAIDQLAVQPVFELAAESKGVSSLQRGRREYSIGLTVQSVADALGVSRQRVYQLIYARVLRGFELKDDAGNPAGIFVDPESVEAFKASGRRPGPKKKAAK